MRFLCLSLLLASVACSEVDATPASAPPGATTDPPNVDAATRPAPADGGEAGTDASAAVDDELDDTGLPSGIHDLRYGAQGIVSGATTERVPTVAYSKKGRAVVQELDTGNVLRLTAVLANGKPDATFGAEGKANITLPETTSKKDAIHASVLLEDDHSVIVFGDRQRSNVSGATSFLARIKNGALDPSFATNGLLNIDAQSGVFSVSPIRSANGAITAFFVGVHYHYPLTTRPRVYRVDASGKIDASFGSSGFVEVIDWGHAIDIDAQGRPLWLWRTSDGSSKVILKRVTAGGMPDATFGASGVREIVPGGGVYSEHGFRAPDGSLLVFAHHRVIGDYAKLTAYRFDANGAPVDAYPGEPTRSRAIQGTLQAIEPLAFAGSSFFFQTSVDETAFIERWTTAGALDTLYAKAGSVNLAAICTFGDRPAWYTTKVTPTGAVVFLSIQTLSPTSYVWRLRRLTR